MGRKLSVSMMCVDFGNLADTVKIFENEKVDYLHIDIMDGHFVPNLMLGVSYVEWLRKNTNIPFDYHFMTEEPANKLQWFPIREKDIVTVHVESDWNAISVLIKIREMGARPVLAISPQTPVSSIKHLINYLDGVCVMLVVPGFSGQSMIRGMDDKIKRLVEVRNLYNSNFFIEVDGHVNDQNIRQLESFGSEIFVAGTSLLGRDPSGYRERIQLFYNL